MKCVLCKAYNAKKELKAHPNPTTWGTFQYLLRSIKERDEKAIASICEEHRNPLKFNVTVVDLFNRLDELRFVSGVQR